MNKEKGHKMIFSKKLNLKSVLFFGLSLFVLSIMLKTERTEAQSSNQEKKNQHIFHCKIIGQHGVNNAIDLSSKTKELQFNKVTNVTVNLKNILWNKMTPQAVNNPDVIFNYNRSLTNITARRNNTRYYLNDQDIKDTVDSFQFGIRVFSDNKSSEIWPVSMSTYNEQEHGYTNLAEDNSFEYKINPSKCTYETP